MVKAILVIDDDPLVLRTVTLALKKYYHVEFAVNGEEAIEKAQKEQFDLILSDIRMPGMNGIETLRRIRQHSYGQQEREIPAIIMTGYTDVDARRQAEELGIEHFLYKPFELTEFLKLVKKCMANAPIYKRSLLRIIARFPIKIKERMTTINGQTLNISENGLNARSKDEVNMNAQVDFFIDFRPVHDPIEGNGKILWVNLLPENKDYNWGLKFLQMQEKHLAVLQDVLKKCKFKYLDKGFVALTREMKNFLLCLKREFDKYDAKRPKEQQQIEFILNRKQDVFLQLNEYFEKVWKIIECLDKDAYFIYQEYFQKELGGILLRPIEINKRIFDKPLGYAGDYEVMNYIFDYHDKAFLGKTCFEKLINHYTCNIPIASSNIKRKDFFKKRILEVMEHCDAANIVSIGSGPARELIELLDEGKITKPLSFKCLDLEKKALDYVKEKIKKIPEAKKELLFISYLHKDLISIIRDKKLKEEVRGSDLIYASGVFDYLNTKMAARLTQELESLLKEQGRLIICNATLENSSHRAYYELLGSWDLIHKSRAEIMAWTKNIKGAVVKFELPVHANNYSFLSITRE